MIRAGATPLILTTKNKCDISDTPHWNQKIHTMSSLQSIYYHSSGSKVNRTAVILGIVGSSFFFIFTISVLIYGSRRRRAALIPNTEAAPAEPRQSSRWCGTYDERPRPLEREATREGEGRVQGMLPPTYQMPAPTHQHPTPEIRRQWLLSHQQVPLPASTSTNDLPPAYKPAAIWPFRSTRG
ncbi:hypothetical protein M3J09_009793 [Ascochyta lentis]